MYDLCVPALSTAQGRLEEDPITHSLFGVSISLATSIIYDVGGSLCREKVKAMKRDEIVKIGVLLLALVAQHTLN